MEIIPAGVEVSFEVTFDSPDLFVAMKVFDDSGADPVLLDTIAMHVFNANSYSAKFTATSDKAYLFHKAVYTDGTYTDLDTDYAAGTESAYAQDLTPGGSSPSATNLVATVQAEPQIIALVSPSLLSAEIEAPPELTGIESSNELIATLTPNPELDGDIL